MKRVLPFFVALAILLQCSLENSHADMIPTPTHPPIPKRDEELRDNSESLPAYAVAGGVVAVAMAGSFGALYFIRKRNGK